MAREKYVKMDNNYKMTDERCRKLQEELMETKGEVAKYKFVNVLCHIQDVIHNINFSSVDHRV